MPIADGAQHPHALLMPFIAMPEATEKGYLYIAQPPLYMPSAASPSVTSRDEADRRIPDRAGQRPDLHPRKRRPPDLVTSASRTPSPGSPRLARCPTSGAGRRRRPPPWRGRARSEAHRTFREPRVVRRGGHVGSYAHQDAAFVFTREGEGRREGRARSATAGECSMRAARRPRDRQLGGVYGRPPYPPPRQAGRAPGLRPGLAVRRRVEAGEQIIQQAGLGEMNPGQPGKRPLIRTQERSCR